MGEGGLGLVGAIIGLSRGEERERKIEERQVQLNYWKMKMEMMERRTLNHRFPYLASTFSLFAIQFLYHRHSVAE